MNLIVLTLDQANLVRGKHGEYSALEPIVLTDGQFGLPPEVLEDPDLADVHDFLSSLPVQEVEIKVEKMPEDLILG
jgi:hypothetical protein